MKRTPRELSEEILRRIEADPSSWTQEQWHQRTVCGTAHCYAGWGDIILSEDEGNELCFDWIPACKGFAQVSKLQHPVRTALGLSDFQWREITLSKNSLDELKEYHNSFFGDDA